MSSGVLITQSPLSLNTGLKQLTPTIRPSKHFFSFYLPGSPRGAVTVPRSQMQTPREMKQLSQGRRPQKWEGCGLTLPAGSRCDPRGTGP